MATQLCARRRLAAALAKAGPCPRRLSSAASAGGAASAPTAAAPPPPALPTQRHQPLPRLHAPNPADFAALRAASQPAILTGCLSHWRLSAWEPQSLLSDPSVASLVVPLELSRGGGDYRDEHSPRPGKAFARDVEATLGQFVERFLLKAEDEGESGSRGCAVARPLSFAAAPCFLRRATPQYRMDKCRHHVLPPLTPSPVDQTGRAPPRQQQQQPVRPPPPPQWWPTWPSTTSSPAPRPSPPRPRRPSSSPLRRGRGRGPCSAGRGWGPVGRRPRSTATHTKTCCARRATARLLVRYAVQGAAACPSCCRVVILLPPCSRGVSKRCFLTAASRFASQTPQAVGRKRVRLYARAQEAHLLPFASPLVLRNTSQVDAGAPDAARRHPGFAAQPFWEGAVSAGEARGGLPPASPCDTSLECMRVRCQEPGRRTSLQAARGAGETWASPLLCFLRFNSAGVVHTATGVAPRGRGDAQRLRQLLVVRGGWGGDWTGGRQEDTRTGDPSWAGGRCQQAAAAAATATCATEERSAKSPTARRARAFTVRTAAAAAPL